MYRHCFHCHADLGRNQVVEPLPVGRRLAFDAEKGRLWVICPACGPWNLTSFGSRWEAIGAPAASSATVRTEVPGDPALCP